MDDQSMPTGPVQPPAAIRLTFEYEGDEVRLVGQQPVDAVPLAGDEPATREESGFALEVRAGDGRVLHRRVLHQPMHASAEVFSPEPGANITRVAKAEDRGTFTVLVPALPDADHVALLAPPGHRRGLAGPASEVRRFQLEVPR